MANNAIVTSVEIFSASWRDKWGEEGACLSLTETGVLRQITDTIISTCSDREAWEPALREFLGLPDEEYDDTETERLFLREDVRLAAHRDPVRFIKVMNDMSVTENRIFFGSVEKAIVTED